MSRISRALCLMTLALCLAPAAHAASQTRPVQFAKGASAATIKGSVKGSDTMDYTLRAAAGQTMTVSMKAGHAGAFFNVLPPESKDVAVYNSSINGNDYAGKLEKTGVYTIRVYLMRNEARRGARSDFTLNVTVTGAASR